MDNKKIWDKEYREKKLMSGDKPQKSVLKFLKFIKKQNLKQIGENGCGQGGGEAATTNHRIKILDLGSGNGKNSVYFAKKGWDVFGLEFSKNAIKLAKNLEKENRKEIKINEGNIIFFENSIGEKFDFSDDFFDVILDVTSSNSLTENERKIYLKESKRVLKKDGYFFARGLLKDGDKNAKFLLKNFSEKEKNTYKIPEFNLIEKVFSNKELMETYGKFFKIIKFKKETHYTTYGYKKYKRNFWIIYMRK